MHKKNKNFDVKITVSDNKKVFPTPLRQTPNNLPLVLSFSITFAYLCYSASCFFAKLSWAVKMLD